MLKFQVYLQNMYLIGFLSNTKMEWNHIYHLSINKLYYIYVYIC